MGQTDMSPYLLDRLLDTLEALGQRTQSFVDLLMEERQAIQALAMDRLSVLTEAKIRLIDEIGRHEEVRKSIVEQLAALWRIPENSMTVRWIAGRIGGPIGDRLKLQQAQLNRNIVAAKHSNEITGAVLHKSLAFLHTAVSIVRAPFQGQPALYSESGSVLAAAREGGLLERRG